ncbi:hypothetical protein [Basilea psittacipulmonis]|uniref:hypothetical protein n=1 Tax=Basilea psittacipulmonis TaxID=1472345 RepID=UPI001300FB37|nr:hypothetical protein [Basilea psittacipulmonis]
MAKNTKIVFDSAKADSFEIHSRNEKLFDSISGNDNNIEKIVEQALGNVTLE